MRDTLSNNSDKGAVAKLRALLTSFRKHRTIDPENLSPEEKERIEQNRQVRENKKGVIPQRKIYKCKN